MLKGVRNGARLYVVDPRRTVSAAVGRRVARPRRRLGHRARQRDGPRDHRRGSRATASSSSAPRPASTRTAASVEPYTLEHAERDDRRPGGGDPRGRARLRAAPTARRSAGRSASPSTTTPSTTCSRSSTWRCSPATSAATGSGLNPLRGQNNVQGGGDMGALPNKLAGLPGRRGPGHCARSSSGRGARRSRRRRGWHLSEMFEAMERGELRALYVIGENPAQSEADADARASGCSRASTTSSCRTSSSRRPPSSPTSCCRPRRAWCESEGTVTEQRAARAARAQGARSARAGARDDIAILCDLARRLGHDWGAPDGRGRLGRAARPLAVARRHELRAARGARRHPVALPRRDPSGQPVPARPALGGPGRAARARRSRRSSTSRRSTTLDDGLPDAPDDGAAARFVQHRRADGRLRVAAAARRDARHLARGRRAPRRRRRRARARRLAPRRGRGAGALRRRRCARAWRS